MHISYMHSKLKGNIAQSLVILTLQKQGLNVFSELGDFSKIDLIAELNGILKRIQVKFIGSDAEFVHINIQKSGPNGYRYTYSMSDVDWFAVYHQKSDKIAWVSMKELSTYSTGINLRLSPSKNNQVVKIRLFDDYGIDGFLRDFTQGTVPQLNGEDKVQTTTSEDGSGN